MLYERWSLSRYKSRSNRLNPYSNGIYSTRLSLKTYIEREALSLNPYSNGIYSMRAVVNGVYINQFES